jgi:glycogen phosphorylase
LSNSNHVETHLPEPIGRLAELARNLWWSWNPIARTLFSGLDPEIWDASNHNAVHFLQLLPPETLARAAADEQYRERYRQVMTAFDAAMDARRTDTWVANHAPELRDQTVAYFSAEFGIHQALPIYSGGLGVLAGDHIKEASDIGLPLVAVSLLYRQGYLNQLLDSEGWQQDVPALLETWQEPTVQMFDPAGDPLIVEVVLDEPETPVRLAIWRVQVGRVSLYLLDANVDGNPEWTRTISSRLYGGDLEHRLRQEIMLGIGGVRALRALGINPSYWHANEGHAAFHLLERVREGVAAGLNFDQASARVRMTTVFTSHTPVPAGHDVFPAETMERYFGHYWPQLDLDSERALALGHHHASEDGFNLTALSFRLADHRNGVSKRHGEITRAMWNGLWPELEPESVPITSVTNGVHLATWVAPRVTALLDAYLPAGWRDSVHDPETWAQVRDIPDEEFWHTHAAAKSDLFHTLRTRSRQRWLSGSYDPGQVVTAGPYLEPDVLTIGFARRFATYKRATLLFTDQDRLERIVNNVQRPVQFVFAGKAHPADQGGKELIQEIIWRARDPRFGGRIAFVEDYDMGLSSFLVAGVDVWLNNPRAPLEASGTSGMKAAANGVPNLSILDGWWREAWAPDNSNGWGVAPSVHEGLAQDEDEATMIYDLIEHELARLYYDRDVAGYPRAWIGIAKEAMRTVGPAFSSRRMMIDYITNLYSPAAKAIALV